MKASTSVMGAACAMLALGLAGCGEVDQTAKTEKVYAGKKDTRAADGPMFGGDKKKWETSLVQRNSTQNEYLRTDISK
ncbi:MAG: hypothetical protein ABL931_06080 [Usitatibacteraceae bacterium]